VWLQTAPGTKGHVGKEKVNRPCVKKRNHIDWLGMKRTKLVKKPSMGGGGDDTSREKVQNEEFIERRRKCLTSEREKGCAAVIRPKR